MTPNLTWNHNPKSNELPEIAIGDRLKLHADDVFSYTIRADVKAINDGRFQAVIVDVFNRDSSGEMEITSGDILAHKGRRIEVRKSEIFEVIRGYREKA